MNKFLILVFCCCFTGLFAQNSTQDIPQGYAIVVGAYSKNKVDLAVEFTKYVADQGYNARFGLNQRASLIYVYVDHTESLKEALSLMQSMREKDKFEDTWIHVKTSEPRLRLSPEEQERAEKTSVAMKKEVVSPLESLYAERFKDVEKEEAEEKKNKTITKPVKETISVKSEIEEEKVNKIEEATVEQDDRLEVHIELINSTTNQPLLGEVQIIDTERAKLLDVAESGEYLKLNDPKNGSGQITLLADVFGFRKLQKEFNYYDPYSGTTNAEIDSTARGAFLTMELVRFRKGDIMTMYNVFYYKDAAVMRPESKYEIDNLLSMMNENENVRIKIHGHVNGKNAGPIISVDKNNYFTLSEENPKGYGSAKALSKQRAEVIRDYLIDKGVESNRMEIKAWGGNRMLHDKNSANAKQNVRVEIEILSE